MKRSTIKFMLDKAKFAYLWVDRILLAPNHFGVSLPERVRFALKGYMPDQYALYDFAHKDAEAYLSEYDWYHSRDINEPFGPLFNNKVICAEFLKTFASVPESLMLKNNGWYVFMDGAEQALGREGLAEQFGAAADAVEMVKTGSGVFMKPISLGKGEGVHRLDYGDEGFLIDGKFASEANLVSLFESSDGYFLSQAVSQHPFLAQIFPDAANTMRVITVRDPKTGEYRVLFAVLRIGTSETAPVNNGSRGGLVANIDLETGELSEARTLHSLAVHAMHPDTKTRIKGAVVPSWEAVKAETLRMARHIPYAHFIAWDVLLTEMGVSVIEANTSSGVNIVQLWGPQRHGPLGDFYRAHGVID